MTLNSAGSLPRTKEDLLRSKTNRTLENKDEDDTMGPHKIEKKDRLILDCRYRKDKPDLTTRPT